MQEIIFFVAKLFSALMAPFPVAMLLLIAGSILLWFKKKQRIGKILVSVATLILLIFGFGPVSQKMMAPLENRYPPVDTAKVGKLPIQWIVVLGGGHISNPDIPPTSQLSCASLARLTEGVRLHRALPQSKMILAGGAVFDDIPEVEISARIAEIMGVRKSDLVLEKKSKDTEEQAVLIGKMVGNDRLVLVTSAAHMPRAMALFQKAGMKPIPAPTNYRVIEKKNIHPADLIPSTGNLGTAGNAIYEYLCTCWSKMRGNL